MIRFSDGETFNAEGALRIEKRRDGLYVVGEGLLIPVDSWEEGEGLIRELSGHEEGRECGRRA